jgi:hypothetical protein
VSDEEHLVGGYCAGVRALAASTLRRVIPSPFRRFWPAALSEAHSRASTIFVNELDALPFESSPNNIKSRATRLTCASFQLVHCHDSNTRFGREILLAPSKEPAGGPALLRRNHAGIIFLQTSDSYNSIKNVLTPFP